MDERKFFVIWSDIASMGWQVEESFEDAQLAYHRLVEAGAETVSILSHCVESTDYPTTSE